MSALNPVPITNFSYEHFTQAPCSLILLDVRPTPNGEKDEYDVYLIFRGYANFYRFETCICSSMKIGCKLVSIGGYNSLALKVGRNGNLQIANHPKNPNRVRLTFHNKDGQLASLLVPKLSIMPFFYESKITLLK
jgi:hypothetical protein